LRLGGPFDFTLEVVAERPGYIALRVTGKDARRAFRNEAGGHRWQRVPPTEKRGRVHTSTITVAVLREPTPSQVRLDPKDLDITTCRGSGKGGQHKNVTDSAVQVKHKPSGIIVRAEAERSQNQNKELALGVLRAKLQEVRTEGENTRRNARRRSQVGCGARGDKRRTVRLQAGQVVDHITGRRTSAKSYLRGQLEKLW